MRKGRAPETIGGHRIIKELGRGSMGVVYLAEQKALHRPIAIKVLLSEQVEDDEFLERFRREGQIAARLRHPNIVQVFEFGEEDDVLYIAMEYPGSRNLKDAIVEAGGKLPAPVALKYTAQLLGALSHAHAQGVVHRDIKPANILISDDGEQVLVTDFSIAHMASSTARLTLTGVAIGTPEYMAPEQLDSKHVDGRADLYATGLILYQMLTGINPFSAATILQTIKMHAMHAATPPHLLDDTISETVSAAIMKALEKQPQNRWSTAQEMLDALSKPSVAPAPEKKAVPPVAIPFQGELKLRAVAPLAPRPSPSPVEDASPRVALTPVLPPALPRDVPRLTRDAAPPEEQTPSSEVQWGPTWGNVTPPGLSPLKKKAPSLLLLVVGVLALLLMGMAFQGLRGPGGATSPSPSLSRPKGGAR